MLDIPNDTGLVCGYCVDPAGRMHELSWAEMDGALADGENVVWLHFNHADARVRAWIEATTYLPAPAKALLLQDDGHMRIEVCGQGLAGVVGDLHHDVDEKDGHCGVLRLYLDSHRLISMRRRPLVAIDKLRRQIAEGLKVQRPVVIVAQFLHHVTDTLTDLLVKLTADVDELEEELLAGRITDKMPELSRIRRVAVRLRRHMVPQQHALCTLQSRLPPWVGEGGAAGLKSAVERLAALGHDLDLVQDRARLLGDQLSGRLMEATNRNLYMLSIVTTIFLPMTLLTGIFGMNLGGLPWQNNAYGFWIGIALMAGVGLVTLVLLRRVRML